MNLTAAGAGSAVAGAVLGALVIIGVTFAVQDNSRPEIDRSGNADSSLLNDVQYGSR